jgi:hypothetical protein
MYDFTDPTLELMVEHLKGLHDFSTEGVPDCEFCINERKPMKQPVGVK